MYGAQPVHSECRWPITSSSSARANRSISRGSSSMGCLLLAAAGARPGPLDDQPPGRHLPMHALQLRPDPGVPLRAAVRPVDDPADARGVGTWMDLLLAAASEGVVPGLSVAEVRLSGEEHRHLQIGCVHRSRQLPLLL